MGFLEISDYERALRFVYELHECDGEIAYERLVAGLRQLIRCDLASINLIDARSMSFFAVDEPNGTCHEIDGLRTLQRVGHEHPLLAHYASTGDTEAYRFTDLETSYLDRTELYDEFYRPLRVKYELSTFFPVNGRIGGIGLERTSRDFSDRDRELLSLLIPHLRQVCCRVSAPCAQPTAGNSFATLTAREHEIATAATRGATNREIAERLQISARTVQKHLEHVYEKLGVPNRTATAAALTSLIDDVRSGTR